MRRKDGQCHRDEAHSEPLPERWEGYHRVRSALSTKLDTANAIVAFRERGDEGFAIGGLGRLQALSGESQASQRCGPQAGSRNGDPVGTGSRRGD